MSPTSSSVNNVQNNPDSFHRTRWSTERWCRVGSMAIALLISTSAVALDVNVVGLFPNKAVVQIEGGALQTLSVGQKAADDVVLLSVGRDDATFNIQGRRVALPIGPARRSPSRAATADYAAVNTDEHGNFAADGAINGTAVRFAVDTGASLVTLPAREASRLGIDYQAGRKTVVKTANGDAIAYRLMIDNVRVGDLVLKDVDAVITEGDSLPVALLGMSFLNRVDMRTQGTVLTLTKRNQ